MATYEDLLALPGHLVGEILDGDLFALPRPSPRHALASLAVGGSLFENFNKPGGSGGFGGWWILVEPEFPKKTSLCPISPVGGASA